MPPANDNFADADIITGTAGTWTGTNTDGTREPGEPDGAYAALSSVWLSWTCPADGLYVFDTFGSAVGDTTLEVFEGADLADLTLLWADDDAPDPDPAHNAWDHSQVGVQGAAGTVYYIRVDGTSWDALTVNWQPRTVNPAATIRFYDHDVLTDNSGYTGRMVLTIPPFTPPGNGTVAEYDLTVTIPAEDGGHTIGMWFGVNPAGSAALAAGATIDTAALPSWITYNGGRRIPSRSISADMAGASVWDTTYNWIYPLGFAFTIDPASDPNYWRTPPPPTITAVTPTSAPMNVTVTVTGTNFFNVVAVTVAGYGGSFTVLSSTELTVVVPSTPPFGVTTLSVITDSGTATVPFTITAPPSISFVHPNPVRPGCALRVTGPNMQYVTQVRMWRTSTGGLADVDFYLDPATTEVVVHVPDDARLTPPFHMQAGDPSLWNLQISGGGPVSKASVGVVQAPTPTEANPFGKMWKVIGGTPLSLWANGDVTQIKQVADGVWIVAGAQYDEALNDYRVMAQIVVDGGGGALTAGPQIVVADPDGTINIADSGYVVIAPVPSTNLVVIGWKHLDDFGTTSRRNTWQVLHWSTSTLSLAGPALTFGAATPTNLSIGGSNYPNEFFQIAAAGISGSRVVLFGGANTISPPGTSGFGQNYDAGYRHFLVYQVSTAGFAAAPVANGIQENSGGVFDVWRTGPDSMMARRYAWGAPTTHTWLDLAVLPGNSVMINYETDVASDDIVGIVPHYTDGDALTVDVEFLGYLLRADLTGRLRFYLARLDPSVSMLPTGPVVFGDGEDALAGWGSFATAYSVGILGLASLVSPELHEMTVLFGRSGSGGAVAFVVDSDGYASPSFDFGPNLNGLGWEWHGWVPYGPRPGNAPLQALVALGGSVETGLAAAGVAVVSLAELSVPCEPYRPPVVLRVRQRGVRLWKDRG